MARAIREKQISSYELVQLHLDCIAQLNPRLNAVFVLNEAALNEAQTADQKLARGESCGPLHGVPVSIKDWIDVAAMPCAGADKRYLKRVPAKHATVVSRLQQAGAIILAKTAATDNSDAYGSVRNPYRLSHSPAGSSSGEAALIAAAGSPAGLGSDSGGSIRQPAHACGIAGLKPTTGRVPLTGHFPAIVPLNDPRTVIGPLSRHVEDLALLLGIIGGPDWQDASVVPVPLLDYKVVELKELRVAFYTRHPDCQPQAETTHAVHRAVTALAEVCQVAEEQEPPGIADTHRITRDYWNRLESADYNIWQPEGPNQLSGEEVARHLFEWDLFRRKVLAFMQHWDVILTPAAEHPAHEHGSPEAAIPYTLTYSLTGYPAGVVRAGTSAEGLPIGVQVVGRPWRDDVVLAVMNYLEESLGGWQAPVL